MTREEAVKYLIKPVPTSTEPSEEYRKQKEAYCMAIEALKTQQELVDTTNEIYAKGYNAAKREIALSGEYERAYQRGKVDATKWIPCSEKLPEVGNTTYLVTVDYGEFGGGTGQRFFYSKEIGWDDDAVVAWMPLPELWKGEQNESDL